jgi:hypothetical protein
MAIEGISGQKTEEDDIGKTGDLLDFFSHNLE